jgi:hypothetical protein
MIMQMTQKIRLTQRVDSDTRVVATEPEAIAIESSPVFSAPKAFDFPHRLVSNGASLSLVHQPYCRANTEARCRSIISSLKSQEKLKSSNLVYGAMQQISYYARISVPLELALVAMMAQNSSTLARPSRRCACDTVYICPRARLSVVPPL